MAKSKNNAKNKLSYISVPSQIINSISSSSLQSLLVSPKKSSRHNRLFFFSFSSFRNPKLWFFTLFVVSFVGMLRFGFNLDIPFSPYPCVTTQPQLSISNGYSSESQHVIENENSVKNGGSQPLIASVQLKAREKKENDEEFEKTEFWKQPDGLGYKPCLEFSRDYRRATQGIVNNRRKYLMVVVSGGLNQQRNQIVDAVVIARILGAALVVPILQVNVIWGDER